MKVTVRRDSAPKNAIYFNELHVGEAFMVEGTSDTDILRVKISPTDYVMLMDYVCNQHVYNYREVYGSDKVVPYSIKTVSLKRCRR